MHWRRSIFSRRKVPAKAIAPIRRRKLLASTLASHESVRAEVEPILFQDVFPRKHPIDDHEANLAAFHAVLRAHLGGAETAVPECERSWPGTKISEEEIRIIRMRFE